jgi:hypothetical protein
VFGMSGKGIGVARDGRSRARFRPGSIACDEATRVVLLSSDVGRPEHDGLKLGWTEAEVK